MQCICVQLLKHFHLSHHLFFFFFRLISILSEVGQTEKDKYMILFICGNLKKKKMMETNLFTKQKQTHRLREWTYGYQGRVEGRTDWEFGTDRYTLLYLKQKTNCIAQGTLPLCNDLNGKRIWKRTDTCTCITEPLCYTPETNTTLLILFQHKIKIFLNYIFRDIERFV